MEAVPFDKYDKFGAYHWKECDRRYANYLAYNPALEARYQIVVDRVRALGGERLLDVGCGDGCLMGKLAPWVRQVVGIDSETAAIGLAREMLRPYPNCEVIHRACYDLPFDNGSFDVAISTDVIEHLEDPAQHLGEIRRVLRPGGYLALTTPKWRPDRKWDERHVKEYRPEELRELLGRYFARVEMRYFWPARWSAFYSTKLGWRLTKLTAIAIGNPFLGNSAGTPESFGQMLAICHEPGQK